MAELVCPLSSHRPIVGVVVCPDSKNILQVYVAMHIIAMYVFYSKQLLEW